MLLSFWARKWSYPSFMCLEGGSGVHILYQHLEVTHLGNWLIFGLWSCHFPYEDNCNRSRTDKWCFDVNNGRTNRSINAEQGMLHLRLYWLTAEIMEWQSWKCVMFYLSYGHSDIEGNRLTQIRLAKEASRTTIRKIICKHFRESKFLRTITTLD